MKFLTFSVSSILLLCLSGCGTSTKVQGEIFIVGSDSQSQKLSLVDVFAVRQKDFKAFLKDWKAELTAEIGEFDKYMEEKCVDARNAFVSAECTEIMGRRDRFAGFVTAHALSDSAWTKSDANGAFQMEILGPGEFLLVATVSRKVDEEYEHLFWAIPITSDGSEKKVMLTSENIISHRKFKDMLNEIP